MLCAAKVFAKSRKSETLSHNTVTSSFRAIYAERFALASLDASRLD